MTKYLLASLMLISTQTAFADVCLIQYGYFAGAETIKKLSDPKLGSLAISNDEKIRGSDTEIGILKTCGIGNREFLIEPIHFMKAPKATEAMTETLSKLRAEGYRIVSCESLEACLIEK